MSIFHDAVLLAILLPFARSWEVEVNIGTSYGYKTKCVTPEGPVTCPVEVSHIGNYPDTFHIYQENGQVCARRTDYDGDWSIHLKVMCRRASDADSQSGDGDGEVVNIGSNLDSSLKCVADPGNVQCDSTAKQLGRTGKYPDTFHIYHNGNQICAKRTDADAGWGLDLVLQCRRSYGSSSSSSGGGNQRVVTIGSSMESPVKCVEAPANVQCDSTAKQLGRTGKYPDTFHIYHEGPKICARRTDANAGWGLDLILECRESYGGGGSIGGHPPGTTVTIGTSPDSSVKCVADPGHVQCDDTAEQVGRTGQWPDTFRIYHDGPQICARRTDANAGWGLDLVLRCKPRNFAGGPGFYLSPKIKWCCEQKLFSRACPYDCGTGSQQSESMWTPHKCAWCCRSRGLGCSNGDQPPVPDLSQSANPPYDCDVADPLSDVPDNIPPHRSNQERYDCAHGSREMWPQDKVQYCRLWLAVTEINYEGLDCQGDQTGWSDEQVRKCRAAEENHEPHKCHEGSSDTWSQEKFEFCCVIKGIGCPQEDPLGTVRLRRHTRNRNDWEDDASQDTLDGSSPDKPRPQEGEEALHFDCAHEDKGDWHTTKRMWCCEKWGLGCEELGNFNCNSGFWNWRKGWSVQKKEYCCKHEKKGCDDRLYDCSEDTDRLSVDAVKWCCDKHKYSKACPFDCQQGLKEWKTGFSDDKKSWCCKHERLACNKPSDTDMHRKHIIHKTGPHSISTVKSHGHAFAGHFLNPGVKPGVSACHNRVDRPQGLVEWCCREMKLCHLKVKFDCKVGLHNWIRWSVPKREHCCGQEVRCVHTTHGAIAHLTVHRAAATHSVRRSRTTNVVHHGSAGHPQVHPIHHEFLKTHHHHHQVDHPEAWYNNGNIVNLHIGQSPHAGTKCVTPSDPVSCPVNSGNVGRGDDYPDQFRVYRKGGQVCADRTDFKELWGLDLVLKCIKLDDARFEKVHIGSSLDSSSKCVAQTSPVSCDDEASQAGRTDPHPDTFHVYHSGSQICVKRTDADSHWGVDLVLYCRKGAWSSPYWGARMRALEDDFDADVSAEPSRREMGARNVILALSAGLAALGGIAYKMYRQSSRQWSLLEIAEERIDCLLNGRTPWIARPAGDEEGAELILA